jgi:hypothetical protein
VRFCALPRVSFCEPATSPSHRAVAVRLATSAVITPASITVGDRSFVTRRLWDILAPILSLK